MPRQRDSQRSRVYEAEKVLNALSTRVDDMKELRGYVKETWRCRITRQSIETLLRPDDPRAPHLWATPEVKDGRGRRRAGGCKRGITMPKWSRTKFIVLHELAHTLTMRIFGENVAGHGWEYCNVYLRLVHGRMGEECYAALRKSFDKHGVKYMPNNISAFCYLLPTLKCVITEDITQQGV